MALSKHQLEVNWKLLKVVSDYRETGPPTPLQHVGILIICQFLGNSAALGKKSKTLRFSQARTHFNTLHICITVPQGSALFRTTDPSSASLVHCPIHGAHAGSLNQCSYKSKKRRQVIRSHEKQTDRWVTTRHKTSLDGRPFQTAKFLFPEGYKTDMVKIRA